MTDLRSNAEPALSGLLPALRRLDDLLERAMGRARAIAGNGEHDPYRGLYIDQSDVDRLLRNEPGIPTYARSNGDGHLLTMADAAPLAALQSYRLSPFDLDTILIALAPELDLRYESVYAYLQDDVTRKRPTVDLALNLLCSDPANKLMQRRRFGPSAPLVRHGLLDLVPDPHRTQDPLLAHAITLDDQITRLLVGDPSLDARLTLCCTLERPCHAADELLPRGETTHIATLVARARADRQPLRLAFVGPEADCRDTAMTLAAACAAPLLTVDLARALEPDLDVERVLRLASRDAWLRDAVLYVDGCDLLRDEGRGRVAARAIRQLADYAGIALLAGRRHWSNGPGLPSGTLAVALAPRTVDESRRTWEQQLAAAGVAVDGRTLEVLADRFPLTPSRIADAVAGAATRARLRALREFPLDDRSCDPTLDDLQAAIRALSGADLAGLARKIEPVHGWETIVLPEDSQVQLREMCLRVAHRRRVMDWGFGQRVARGSVVSALFAGPPGTGKTTAAEIVAAELGLDLYKIELAGVVSKYIGETEKNLERIFAAAEETSAVLFFDDADVLFGKRTEVTDAHDRYANIEVAYLLQRMEQYEGITILATNLRQNMDEAFVRRLQFIIEFPFPDPAQRREIWRVLMPPQAPCDETVDFDLLAEHVPLAGGYIRNIVLDAAFLAAAGGDTGAIGMKHLVRATWREYQKLGRLVSTTEEAALGRWRTGPEEAADSGTRQFAIAGG
jgi:hypothetical protein